MQSRRNLFGINIPNVRPLRSLCALSLAGVMATTAAQGAGAQASDIQPVVGVHSGTCADYVPESAYDFGVMTSIPVQGVAEEGEGRAEGVDEGEGDLFGDDELVGAFGEDQEFAEDDEGYLSDDLDGDGIFEIGMDEDGDGVLDENEVLGEDVNDDGELTEDELST